MKILSTLFITIVTITQLHAQTFYRELGADRKTAYSVSEFQNGYVIGGEGFLIRMDLLGKIESDHSSILNQPQFGSNVNSCLKIHDDSILIAVGRVLKLLDKNLDTVWTRVFERNISDINLAPDGGFLLAIDGGNFIKTNNRGHSIFTTSYSFSANTPDETIAMEQIDNTYFMMLQQDDYKYYLISYNTVTKKKNIKSYGSSNQYTSGNCNFIKTSDDNILIVGDVGYTGFATKMDPAFNHLWSISYTPKSKEYWSLNSIAESKDGSFIVTGNDLGNLEGKVYPMLLKFDKLGTVLWSKEYSAYGMGYMFSIISCTDNNFLAVGGIGESLENGVALKVNENGSTTSIIKPTKTENTFNIYPSISHSSRPINLISSSQILNGIIYNVNSESVQNLSSSELVNSQFNTEALKPGIYFLRVTTISGFHSQKFTITE